MLPNVNTAKSLPFTKINGNAAAPKEIEDAYNVVYSDSAKLALFDMIYTLGANGLRMKFPIMNIAINRRDWPTAARSSHRLNVQPDRNFWTENLLSNAAKNK
jgi:GH24 family phage-related lysozyme (muramidase)